MVESVVLRQDDAESKVTREVLATEDAEDLDCWLGSESCFQLRALRMSGFRGSGTAHCDAWVEPWNDCGRVVRTGLEELAVDEV